MQYHWEVGFFTFQLLPVIPACSVRCFISNNKLQDSSASKQTNKQKKNLTLQKNKQKPTLSNQYSLRKREKTVISHRYCPSSIRQADCTPVSNIKCRNSYKWTSDLLCVGQLLSEELHQLHSLLFHYYNDLWFNK